MLKTLYRTAAAALLALPLSAAVKTYWVPGVNQEKGWYDADKSGPADNQMCWAASAANMIAWWQDRNPETAAKAKAPTGTAVWDTFRKALRNTPGSPYAGSNWWFCGGNLPQPNFTAEGSKCGGYYKDMVGPGEFAFAGRYTRLMKGPSFGAGQKNISEHLKDLIQGGNAISISIQRLNPVNRQVAPGGHMISLWGVDYDDEKKQVTRVYLTDSDDAISRFAPVQKGLFAADCTYATDLKEPQMGQFSSLVFRTDTGWFANNAVITAIISLNGDCPFITEGDKAAHAAKPAKAKKGDKKGDKKGKTPKAKKKPAA